MNSGAENPGTDFFGHVVSKALVPEPALAPRLLSLFEPARLLDVTADWEQTRQTIASADERSSDFPTEQPKVGFPERATKATDSPAAEISGDEPKKRPIGKPRKRSEETVVPPRLDITTAMDVDLYAPRPSPSPGPLPLSSVIERRISESHELWPTDINMESSVTDRRMRFEEKSVVPGNKPPDGFRLKEDIVSAIFPADGEASIVTPEALTTSAQTVVPDDVAEHRAATPPMAPRRIIEPKVVRRLMPVEPRRAEEAPVTPVVSVTIGRIEIRAVPDQPAAARRRTEARVPKPMSLEDYLKQRGGGR